MPIRRMQPGDLPGVYALQCQAYPADYHEALPNLATRIVPDDHACFVAESPDGTLTGYVFAHLWSGPPPALHTPLPPCPRPDHLFLHDLAVAPTQQGQGTARQLLSAVRDAARQRAQSEIRLVALHTAQAFWLAQAFQSHPTPLDRSYGRAILMSARPG